MDDDLTNEWPHLNDPGTASSNWAATTDVNHWPTIASPINYTKLQAMQLAIEAVNGQSFTDFGLIELSQKIYEFITN